MKSFWNNYKSSIVLLGAILLGGIVGATMGEKAVVLKPIDIKTLPHPGFPTDVQAQFMAMLTVANGSGTVIETVFENRFMHVAEFNRMGADIKIEGRSAIVKGVNQLYGAKVNATDLRAGAALILCGLIAEGETQIGEIYHIQRGYVDIDKKITALGGNIQIIED